MIKKTLKPFCTWAIIYYNLSLDYLPCLSDRLKAYARAGVDVDLGNKVKAGLPALLKSAHRPEVLGKVGGFGGLFSAKFPKMRDPVLVASIEGVGTKIKVAEVLNRQDTLGVVLVKQ